MGLSPQLITEKLYKRAVQRLQHLSKDNREAIRGLLRDELDMI